MVFKKRVKEEKKFSEPAKVPELKLEPKPEPVSEPQPETSKPEAPKPELPKEDLRYSCPRHKCTGKLNLTKAGPANDGGGDYKCEKCGGNATR